MALAVQLSGKDGVVLVPSRADAKRLAAGTKAVLFRLERIEVLNANKALALKLKSAKKVAKNAAKNAAKKAAKKTSSK